MSRWTSAADPRRSQRPGLRHRQDLPEHTAFRDWLTAVVNGEAAYGLSELVLGRFIRVLTNPKVFNVPTALDESIAAADRLRFPGLRWRHPLS